MPEIGPMQLQLRSRVGGDARLELSLVEIAVPTPAADEVLIRVEAAPLNPSDQGLLFGAADLSTAVMAGTPARPLVTATIPAAAMKGMAGRLEQSLPVGNEGAGVVVGAGASDASAALMGRRAAVFAGAMYTQYRVVKTSQCLVLPDTVSAAEGASAFVNPLTCLGMLGTLRSEGHRALVHTAAASNLGQMLVRLCAEENVPLVNIVRSAAQESLLRAIGARHVCNSQSADFTAALTEAITATGATLAFDAIGGGTLAGQILSAMEESVNRNATEYSRYGSTVHKQVYVYGGLDTGPIEIRRDFGMAWGVGGWLVMAFLQRSGPAVVEQLKQRVVAGLKTTFASSYTQEIALTEVMSLPFIEAISRRATGRKYLINPTLARRP